MNYVCWENREFTYEEEELVNDIQLKFFNISEFNARLLVSRGITDYEEIAKFLNPNINQFYSASLMKDSDKFIHEVIWAIDNKKKIIIFSDYDSDGTNGCVVLLKCLKKLGADVDYHSNNRFKEGYGLSIASVDNILSKYEKVDMIITIDNGISSFSAVEYCNLKGIKVLITDHHDIPEVLPAATCVVNPKRIDCNYPFKYLCGAGVIFKLMLLLFETLKQDINFVYDLIDLVAVATIGDIVPLVSENRVIVVEGLKRINNENCRMSFKYLKESLNKKDDINESFIAFNIVPLINACSRINGDCYQVVDMLVQENVYFIKSHLNSLIELNNLRKNLTVEQTKLALELMNDIDIESTSCIVLCSEEFHEGIIGLVANKIVEKFNLPTIILSKNKDTKIIKGSCRSVNGVNIRSCLTKCSSHLLNFGGHAGAAGLSLELSSLPNFIKDINKIISKLLKDTYNTVYIDYVAEELNEDIVKDFSVLAPFGAGFEKPQIGLKDFKCFSMEILKNSHLKIYSDNVTIMNFNCDTSLFDKLYNADSIKAIGFPEIQNFRGSNNIVFTVSNSNILKAKEKNHSNFVKRKAN